MRRVTVALVVVLSMWAGRAEGDEFSHQQTWSGPVDYFATGAPVAVDTNDTTNVDAILHPAPLTVSSTSMPTGATVLSVFLYWAGSINQTDSGVDCDPADIDINVAFLGPGMGASQLVVADECYCSGSLATSYDVQVCRRDVTSLLGVITDDVDGVYEVDGFTARIAESYGTGNASYSLVFVYEEVSLPPRTVGLYDGVQVLYNSDVTVSLLGIEVDNPAVGEITIYGLEADKAGELSNINDWVKVKGQPNGAEITLSDANNPADDLFNQTINTTTPVQRSIAGTTRVPTSRPW